MIVCVPVRHNKMSIIFHRFYAFSQNINKKVQWHRDFVRIVFNNFVIAKKFTVDKEVFELVQVKSC